METKVCLDTDFLVNFLRNKDEEAQFIMDHESSVNFATTSLNIFELYYGAFKSGSVQNVRRVKELEEALLILNLSPSSVQSAGKILALLEKKGRLVDFRDVLIGSIAKDNGFSLKTYNVKHFERIPGLTLI